MDAYPTHTCLGARAGKDVNAQAHTHIRGILYFPQPYPICNGRLLSPGLWSIVHSYARLPLAISSLTQTDFTSTSDFPSCRLSSSIFLLTWKIQRHQQVPCLSHGPCSASQRCTALLSHFSPAQLFPLCPQVYPKAIWLERQTSYVLLFFGMSPRLFIGVMPRISSVFVEGTHIGERGQGHGERRTCPGK